MGYDGSNKTLVRFEVLGHMVQRMENLAFEFVDERLVGSLAVFLLDESDHLVADGLGVIAGDQSFTALLELRELFFVFAGLLLLLIFVERARVDQSRPCLGPDGVAR